MNEKVYRTLEFHKILSALSERADSGEGKRLAEGLRPASESSEIERRLQETEDALDRIRLYGPFRFSGLRELSASLKRLEIASSLSISELLQFSALLDLTERARSYGRAEEKAEEKGEEKRSGGRGHYTRNAAERAAEEREKRQREDSLIGYFRALLPLSPENRELKRCILSEEQIADDASAGLSSVRRRIRSLEEQIHSQLSSLLASSQKMLQDSVITMRDGRYCLPVKAEYKSSFPGMIHDQSSTGATLFIEPQSIVRRNNEIRELRAEEKREIEKLLERLSASLSPHTEGLSENIRLLSHLDFVFAKAKLSLGMKAVRPHFSEKRSLSLREARHPLIPGDRVVPITIRLGSDFTMLVITGPNTGGKTVCLKTAGLLQLMGQAGLFIPAAEGSELALFREIFADIGDEQSIEQSLSTFSAHMSNTVRILREADEESLCLFDELGAGTDPTEGAALAMAILHTLHERGIRSIATTHYAEIKVYALSTPGVENAGCEFDLNSLSPTYRLLIGVPGKSNAFAISRKLGLPEEIIEDAGRRLEAGDVKLEDVIASLEESRITAERERQEIERYREEIAEYKRRARESSKGVEKGRDKILNRAREEAASILAEAKETADSIVKELRKREQSGGSTLEAEKLRSGLKQELRELQEELGKTERARGPARPLSKNKIRIGDIVRVLPLNLTARVSTLPDRDEMLFVTAGIIRTKVALKDLELLQRAPALQTESGQRGGQKSSGGMRVQKALRISPEIKLIGKMTAEAMPELSKYLDDACLAHLPEVRIVHGRGTGALRNMVHGMLRKDPHIESFRLGEYGEGSDGVTIAYFKK